MTQARPRLGRPGFAPLVSRAALLLAILATCPVIARADTNILPQGGDVVVGAATIRSLTPGSVDVTTATDRTAIDWRSFSIGAGNSVTITQPSASSLTLNQVTGSDASRIFGSLSSNGQVVLANANGIWFGPGSHVDVAAIVASTATASQTALNAFAHGGALMLDQAGRPDASIVNDGSISLGAEGLAGLVAPGVANNGIIAARLGQVVLASGTTATLDFYGDGLISFAVGGSVNAQAKDQTGANLSAAVVNAGTISDAGGTVLLTAATAKTVVDNAINMSGVIVASAVSDKGGEIDLDGGTGGVSISGTLDASSPGGQGGAISIAGNPTDVTTTAKINAGTVSVSANRSLLSDGDVSLFAASLGGRIVAGNSTQIVAIQGSTTGVESSANDVVVAANDVLDSSLTATRSADVTTTQSVASGGTLTGVAVGLIIDGVPVTSSSSGGDLSLGGIGTGLDIVTSSSNPSVEWSSYSIGSGGLLKVNALMITSSVATSLVDDSLSYSEGSYLVGVAANPGGLVGTINNTGVILNSYSTATPATTATTFTLGGFVGENAGGALIAGSTSAVSLSGSVVSATSGLVGIATGSPITIPAISSSGGLAHGSLRLAQALPPPLPDSVLHPTVSIPVIALPQSSAGSDSIGAIETSLGAPDQLPPAK